MQIVVCADSGFAREPILAWCEAQRAARSAARARDGRRARAARPVRGTTRHFADFEYRTLDTWSRARRVIGKAETGAQGDNPRFILTNIPSEGLRDAKGHLLLAGDARSLYEDFYCERGNAENRIQQMTLDLHSDRTSTHWLSSNQLRLWLSAFGYLLLERLRAWGLAGTELAAATAGNLRLRLLKIAAQVTVSVRRVHVRLCSAYPLQALFAQCQARLAARAGL